MSVIIAVVAVLAVITILVLVSGRRGSSGSGKGDKDSAKNRAQIIRNATKTLAHDPYNTSALIPLSDLYFREHLWDKAYPLYETLVNLAPSHQEINTAEACLRMGICAIKLNKPQDAMRGLVPAYKMNSANFEVNYYLGLACYKSNDFEKAIPCLKKALTINPEATGVAAPLGSAMYKAHHFKESLPILRKALNENPQDKETLFAMADAMQECGAGDKALKVFMHLRPDPVYGPKSSLAAGMIHNRAGQVEQAIQDYDIGLKLKDIPQDIFLELNYRLAQCYFSTNKISQGIACLNAILATVPSYKDVSALLSRYKELNSNSNLQLYLTAANSDFVALCRRLVTAYYVKSFVKIVDVEVKPDNVEILCEVESSKWEDVELFRFYRTTGSVGDLFVRDFHTRIRDKKVDRGFCVAPGTFSEDAHKFIEGRPIDLIEKAALMKLLKTITMVN